MLATPPMPPTLRSLNPVRGWCAAIPAVLFAALLLSVLFTRQAAGDVIVRSFTPDNPGTATVDYGVWNSLLRRHVKPDASGLNRVDYKTFKARDHQTLKAFLKTLTKTPVRALTYREQFAFWINLYNAVTIDVVLDHYPVSSIRKITFGRFFAFGPWKEKLVRVSGVKLSLDDIEKKILLPLFRDPRIHYAVNCASIGCPNLATTAYTGARLEQMLDAGARSYIAHPRGVTVSGRRVTASKIYRWYQRDFGGSETAVLDHIRKFAPPKLRAQLAGIKNISGYAYDWSLNDVR